MDKNQEEEEEEEKLKTRIPKPWVKKTRSFFAKSHSSKKLQKKITTVSKKTPFQQSSTKFSPALHDVGGSFCRSLSSLRIRLEAMWGQSPPPSLFPSLTPSSSSSSRADLPQTGSVLPVRRPVSSLLQRFFSLRSSHKPRRSSPTRLSWLPVPTPARSPVTPHHLLLVLLLFRSHCQKISGKKRKRKRKK